MRIIIGILIGLGIATIGVHNFMSAVGNSILIMKESWLELYDAETIRNKTMQPMQQPVPKEQPVIIDKVKGTMV